MKLTMSVKEMIRRWLVHRAVGECPFDRVYVSGDKFERKYCKICKEYFPRVRKKPSPCPCWTYQESMVIRRARQMVKGTI